MRAPGRPGQARRPPPARLAPVGLAPRRASIHPVSRAASASHAQADAALPGHGLPTQDGEQIAFHDQSTMATRSYALQRAGALRLVVAPVLKEVPRLIPLGLGPWEGAHGVCYSCYCTRSSDRPCGPGSSAAPEEEDHCCLVRRSHSRSAPSASAPLAPLRARSNSSPREIMVFGDGGNRLGDSSMGFGLDLPPSACRPDGHLPATRQSLFARWLVGVRVRVGMPSCRLPTRG